MNTHSKPNFAGALTGLLAGAFLVLASHEAAGVGSCLSARLNKPEDLGCGNLMPGVSLNPTGGQRPGCPPCGGMARWWVTEPYLNVWVADEPLSYRLSSGDQMVFRWTHRQGTTLSEDLRKREQEGVSTIPIRMRSSSTGTICTRTNVMSDAQWCHNWWSEIVVWDRSWETNADFYDQTYYTDMNFTPPLRYLPLVNYEGIVFFGDGTETTFTRSDADSDSLNSRTQTRVFPIGTVSGQEGLRIPQFGIDYLNPYPLDSQNVLWVTDPQFGFRVVHVDGSQDIYGLIFLYGNPDPGSYQQPNLNIRTTSRAYLTQHIDPQGRITTLGYKKTVPVDVSKPVYVLKYLVDPDGRTNTYHYNAYDAYKLDRIEDPYGRSANLTYGAYGLLSSITDAVGVTSSFGYLTETTTLWNRNGQTGLCYGPPYPAASPYASVQQIPTSGWLSSITTPYGTTTFAYYRQRESDATPSDYMEKAVFVKEPGDVSARQLYYYKHKADGLVPASATPPVVGDHIFDAGSGSGPHPELSYRNSFHWNSRNYGNLPAAVRSGLETPTANFGVLSSLTANDYRKAHMKHWLLLPSDFFTVTDALSSERLPSPNSDGSTEGERVWYDYPGRTTANPHAIGSSFMPSCIARTLPNGTPQFLERVFNSNQMPSQERTSYSIGTSQGILTNFYHYAANLYDVVTWSNSVGQTLRIVYNDNHQPEYVTNSLGYVTRFSWDFENHNLRGITGPGGWNINIDLHTDGFPSSVTWSPQGRVVQIPDYMAGLPKRVHTSGTGVGDLWFTNTWDGLNRLVRTDYTDGTTRSNYYKRLDLAGQKDRLGNWTWYGYDGLQNLSTITDPRSNVTSLAWCSCGALESITDATNQTTSFIWNNRGLLTSILYPDNSQVTRQYDNAGRLTNVFDGLGRGLKYSYNNQGLVTSISNAYRLQSFVQYDSIGRPHIVIDGAGVSYTNTYDGLNRLTSRKWMDGFADHLVWSTNGLAYYTNRDGKLTAYWRDEAGRLLGETNANHEVTRFVYNALGSVKDLWDGRDNLTRWTFDEYGRMTNKTDGLNREVLRLTYDPNGNVTNRWTREFENLALMYDPAGNMTNMTSSGSRAASIDYVYDTVNRLTRMVDAVGESTFTYTPTGRLLTENGPFDADTVTYGYTQGLRTSMSLNSSPALNHSYRYDNARRLDQITSGSMTFGYGYETNLFRSLPNTLSLPNGSFITNHFDALSRLDYTALVNNLGATLDGYSYTHDPLGLRTNLIRDLGITESTIIVGHDDIGQITSWTAKEPSGALRLNEKLGWGYDKAGNLETRANNALTQTFVNDAANQATNVSRSGTLTVSGVTALPASEVKVNEQTAQRYEDFTFASPGHPVSANNSFTNSAKDIYGAVTSNTLSVSLPASVTMTYDQNGNLTSDGVRSLSYDALNQLTTNWLAGAWKMEHVYDGLSRRRVTREYAWQGNDWVKTNETRYIYDGRAVIQERTAANILRVSFTRGLDLSGSLQGAGGIGGLLARTDHASSSSYFYHADGAGNVTALSDGQGRIAARYLYNPFGRLIAKWGPMADVNRYQFSSKESDYLSGLSYYGYRFYDPTLQRWLTRDPLGEAGGINLYGFVGNDPIGFIDPLGLHWADWSFFQWWEKVTRPLRGLNPDGSEERPRDSGMKGPQEPQNDTMGLQPSLLGELLLPGGGLYMSGAGTSRCAAKAFAEAAARRKAAELAEALARRDAAGTAASVAKELLDQANAAYRQAMQDLEYAGRAAGTDSAAYQQALAAWRAAQSKAASAARNYEQASLNWTEANTSALKAGR